ncbi:MAG TPA: ABC transporter ATP-binding protein [Candidatus Limnocylindrales bacterium]|nr:ABC transporter ATP-binding protein [Candidatus Limnocylindrales bacterium]
MPPENDAPDYAIDVQNVGVRYNLRLTKKNTLRQTLGTIIRKGEGERTFWALREVTFRLVHGESLAVIGPNGAGKSTLLQTLAGIITPSEGVVDVRGHVSSLLQLGAGFNQELNGRDNIMLAGAFMGVPHSEMVRRSESIVDFADIGQFIDAPIKTYSSGMRARLGFAIATSVDPDILLLDEVLATGDAVFREKSRARVLELARAAKAIVLVTHDMQWVTEFCNRAMLIEKGHVVAEGEPEEIVRLHKERSLAETMRKQAELIAKLGDSPGFSPWAIQTQAAIKAAREAGTSIDDVAAIQAMITARHGAAEPASPAAPSAAAPRPATPQSATPERATPEPAAPAPAAPAPAAPHRSEDGPAR